MTDVDLERVQDRGRRAGGDWVTSIATNAEIQQLSSIPPRLDGADRSRSDAIVPLVDWHDAARWPTLHALLKDRELAPAGSDPWLAGFIDGALEAIGHSN